MSKVRAKLLIQAARDGKLNKVKILVDSYGLSFCSEWSEGYVLLCEALSHKQETVAEFLLSQGARVTNICSETKKSSPLHFSAKIPYVSETLIALLLERNADVNAKNEEGQTPLHLATEMRNKKVVRLLLDRGAHVNAADDFDITPLHIACFRGESEIIELLLSYKACSKNSRISPLHLALYPEDYGGTKIKRNVLLLLEKGYNVNAIAKSKENISSQSNSSRFVPANVLGCTPLHVACMVSDCEEVVDLLLKNGADVNCSRLVDGYKPLHISSKNHHNGVIELLLKLDADPNATAQNDCTPLHIAVQYDKEYDYEDSCIFTMISLLKASANINAKDKNGDTPLHLAVRQKFTSVAEFLLKINADVDAVNKNNLTPLHLAVMAESLALVECILQFNPDTNNDNNQAALRTAYRGKGEENAKIFKNLYQHGFLFPQDDVNNAILLHFAVERGDTKILHSFLKRGANPNCSHDGQTLLHCAVRAGHIEIVQILVDAKANVNAKDKYRKTPIDYSLNLSCTKKCAELFNLLLARGACVSNRNSGLLCKATQLMDFSIFKILVDRGFDVNYQDETGKTALLYTTIEKHYPKNSSEKDAEQIVSHLLKKGCDVNVKSEEGLTTLHGAAYLGFEKIVDDLLNHGADVNATSKVGKTPLHFAAIENQVKISETLLKYGARVNATDEKGRTPLNCVIANCYCYSKDYSEVLEILLNHGAAVNSVDSEGKSPLFQAITQHSGRKIVDILLKHGANVNAKAGKGLSLFHVCASRSRDLKKDDWLIDVLLSHGANINARSENNETPLHVAVLEEEHGYGSRGQTVEALLQAGANVNAVCNAGATPLLIAVKLGLLKTAATLLQFDANVDLRDSSGKTALHLASLRGNFDLVDMLLKHGANVSLKTNLGHTAFDLAYRYALSDEVWEAETYTCPYFDYDDSLISRSYVCEVLVRHIIKFTTAGLHVDPKDLNCQDLFKKVLEAHEYEEFKLECGKEFERMRAQKICCHLSLNNLLKRNSNNLLSRNEMLVQTLAAIDFKKFPIYRNMLESSFKRDKYLYELLLGARSSFETLIKLRNACHGIKVSSLPVELKELILSFLDLRDLKNLISCTKSLVLK